MFEGIKHKHPHVEHVVFADNATLTSIATKLSRHIANADVHVTEEDKERWNNKVDQSVIDDLKTAVADVVDKIDTTDDSSASPRYVTTEELSDAISDFITSYEVDCKIENLKIPTKVSDLTNDSQYITESQVSAVLSNGGYVTREDLKDIDLGQSTQYVLPYATVDSLGGIKVGYQTNAEKRFYKVDVDDGGNAFVNVPWVDSKSDVESANNVINSISSDLDKIREIADKDAATLQDLLSGKKGDDFVRYSDSFTNIVKNEENSVATWLRQTDSEVSSLALEIDKTNDDSAIWSEIKQTANRVSVVVDSDNTIKAAEIYAALNKDGSTIGLRADKIVFDGDTYGKNLTLTGEVVAEKLKAYGSIKLQKGEGYISLDHDNDYPTFAMKTNDDDTAAFLVTTNWQFNNDTGEDLAHNVFFPDGSASLASGHLKLYSDGSVTFYNKDRDSRIYIDSGNGAVVQYYGTKPVFAIQNKTYTESPGPFTQSPELRLFRYNNQLNTSSYISLDSTGLLFKSFDGNTYYESWQDLFNALSIVMSQNADSFEKSTTQQTGTTTEGATTETGGEGYTGPKFGGTKTDGDFHFGN